MDLTCKRELKSCNPPHQPVTVRPDASGNARNGYVLINVGIGSMWPHQICTYYGLWFCAQCNNEQQSQTHVYPRVIDKKDV